jgi:hypothetical protein
MTMHAVHAGRSEMDGITSQSWEAEVPTHACMQTSATTKALLRGTRTLSRVEQSAFDSALIDT